jgi:hypothetical protein
MSYRTYNIIIKINEESEKEDLKNRLTEYFKFYNIREFFTPFRGIVCQANNKFKEYSFEQFPDQFFRDQDEVEDYYSESENHAVEFSKKNGDLEVVYVEVDCFGGRCASNGFVVQNGVKTKNEDVFHSAHMKLLHAIDPQYDSWHFYPFTRTFFTDKGGINGEILNFTFLAVLMAFNMEVEHNPDFEFNAAENEMQILLKDKFELYLMNLGRERIKVLGRLFDNSAETINNVKDLLNEALQGLEYHIEIDNFENGEKDSVSSISREKFQSVAKVSYRAQIFNEIKIDFSPDEKEPVKNATTKKEGFFGKIFKNIFGK